MSLGAHITASFDFDYCYRFVWANCYILFKVIDKLYKRTRYTLKCLRLLQTTKYTFMLFDFSLSLGFRGAKLEYWGKPKCFLLWTEFVELLRYNIIIGTMNNASP